MLGLDNAGKTIALYRLIFDQYINTMPTFGFNCERICGDIGKAKAELSWYRCFSSYTRSKRMSFSQIKF
ncbi:ADP-ribosylation factor-like protein 4C [Temnothorax americanus]|uniref:ADP-ribosylation factor-like protein 4C n=1 Tax=Temnothorax americanus TaxID=1964332 RepID=UPI00406990EF